MDIDKGNSRDINNVISQLGTNEVNTMNQIIIDEVVGDAALEKLNLNQKITLIKFDIEGHEHFVAEGLRKTITTHQPIIY